LKKGLLIGIFILAISNLRAQMLQSFVHQGEFGFSVGAAHYFGDLNTFTSIKRPKLAAGAFFRKQFGDYLGVRLSANYAQLGYSDVYSPSPLERRRNLSFNTDVWEIGIAGDFNFFRFNPEFPEYIFTPYVTMGVSIFSYDPYTYFNNQKYFLRDIGTEGQGSPLYPNLQKYGTTAISIPFGVGVKYSLNPKLNVFAELTYRFTNTDFLDDVSGVYAPNAYPSLEADGVTFTPFGLLQDRSYETSNGVNYFTAGAQRGNSKKADSFVTLQFGLSFNLSSYRCPDR